MITWEESLTYAKQTSKNIKAQATRSSMIRAPSPLCQYSRSLLTYVRLWSSIWAEPCSGSSESSVNLCFLRCITQQKMLKKLGYPWTTFFSKTSCLDTKAIFTKITDIIFIYAYDFLGNFSAYTRKIQIIFSLLIRLLVTLIWQHMQFF